MEGYKQVNGLLLHHFLSLKEKFDDCILTRQHGCLKEVENVWHIKQFTKYLFKNTLNEAIRYNHFYAKLEKIYDILT